MYCILFFIFGILIGEAWENYINAEYLAYKASKKHKEVLKVGNKSYYLVSEKEYLRRMI